MGDHLIDGEFQSDKYPTTPRGKVPLSCKDPLAQDLLWQYAQRRRSIDEEFSSDLEQALYNAGFIPGAALAASLAQALADALRELSLSSACPHWKGGTERYQKAMGTAHVALAAWDAAQGKSDG